MARPATQISLTEQDRATLQQWARSGTTEQRLALRARIILAAAAGQASVTIAGRLGVRHATVSKWRTRFAAHGLDGLQDAPRPGPPRRYDEETEQRILDVVSQPPPAGHATWTGTLVAETLGDVSDHHVWRVLRQHGIHLQRRRSHEVSTDPEFSAKAADVVGLYLDPPEKAVVLCVDEKPSIQALERAPGVPAPAQWPGDERRQPSLPAPRHHDPVRRPRSRHGPHPGRARDTTPAPRVPRLHERIGRRVFAGAGHSRGPGQPQHPQAQARPVAGPSSQRALPLHPHQRLLAESDRDLVQHPQPTRPAGGQLHLARQLRDAIDAFIAAYNSTAQPFEWKKRQVFPTELHDTYAELCR